MKLTWIISIQREKLLVTKKTLENAMQLDKGEQNQPWHLQHRFAKNTLL